MLTTGALVQVEEIMKSQGVNGPGGKEYEVVKLGDSSSTTGAVLADD
eukprot:SAG31_NODE_6259_length_2099_cov_1.561500_1_plen_47_part_00